MRARQLHELARKQIRRVRAPIPRRIHHDRIETLVRVVKKPPAPVVDHNRNARITQDPPNLRMACNGVLGGAATGTLGLDAALDHWDLGTNGSGANSIFGINERIAMGPNLTFTDAQLIAMTT